jgi:hypothetical protein
LWNGVGCGLGETQVSKYVAVVADAADQDLDGRVYDCFADANFFGLPASDAVTTYTVRIFGYSQADYEARLEAIVQGQRDRTRQIAASPRYVTTCDALVAGGSEAIGVCAEVALASEAGM